MVKRKPKLSPVIRRNNDQLRELCGGNGSRSYKWIDWLFHSDWKGISKLRKAFPNNPIVGYLNINSLNEKITCFRDIISASQIDIIYTDKNKLDKVFQTASSKLMGTSFLYLEKIEIQKAMGKIVFVREGIVAKDLYHCESSSIESICIELFPKENVVFCLYIHQKISIKERSSKKFQVQ